MTPADIEPVSAAILADDWGDRRAWFEFAVSSPHIRTFVAEDARGAAIGTGVATMNGPVGWIGTIWVAPPWRGQGVGRALTEAPIAAAEAAGCRTLVLVATAAGQPLYERLGFAVQTWYHTMDAPPWSGPPDPSALAGSGPAARERRRRVRAWRPDDLDAMAALDLAATGEDRRHLLAAFASPTGTLVVVGPDQVPRGFVIRAPWGGGATIAPDIDDAFALLAARRAAVGPGKRLRAGVVTSNIAGRARLEADGWTEAWRAPRLVRGEPLDWRPTAIWGQFNHAIG
jgi:ribosomal protein S18 acetylase RimI-like enzyme